VKTKTALPDVGCAVVFTLYIQNSRLERVIGTFLETYIWQRISRLKEIAEVWGLDKDWTPVVVVDVGTQDPKR